jgi:hypothetical protein
MAVSGATVSTAAARYDEQEMVVGSPRIRASLLPPTEPQVRMSTLCQAANQSGIERAADEKSTRRGQRRGPALTHASHQSRPGSGLHFSIVGGTEHPTSVGRRGPLRQAFALAYIPVEPRHRADGAA